MDDGMKSKESAAMEKEDFHETAESTDLVSFFEKQLQQTMSVVEKMSVTQREAAMTKLQAAMNQKPLSQNAAGTVVDSSEIPINKRGRGRPRKSGSPQVDRNVTQDGDTKQGCQESNEIKRGRGRPRKSDHAKNASTAHDAERTTISTSVTRGRGRPRKSHVVAQQTSVMTDDNESADQNKLSSAASTSRYSGRMRTPSAKVVDNPELEVSLHNTVKKSPILSVSGVNSLSQLSPNEARSISKQSKNELTTFDLRHFKTAKSCTPNDNIDTKPNLQESGSLEKFDLSSRQSESSQISNGSNEQLSDKMTSPVKTEPFQELPSPDDDNDSAIPATTDTKAPRKSNVVDLRLVFKYEGKTIVAERGISSLIVKEGVKTYRCSLCNKTSYARTNIMTHVRGHMGMKPFDCEICGKKFVTSSNKQRHVRETHLKKRPKSCDICGKGFFTEASIDRHKQKIHAEKLQPKQEPGCTICHKEFKSKKALHIHMIVHGSNQHKCEICAKEFKFRTNYLRHMKIHTNTRPFACTQCDKRFIEARSLRVHIKTKHEGQKIVPSGEPTHHCTTCGRKFHNQSSYTKHMLAHTGEKPHSCNICRKSFSLKANLKRHMNIHQEEKPFKCTVCNRSLGSKVTLKYHMRNHNNEKPFACGQCDKAFASSMSLRAHMPVHHRRREFSCTDCSRTFLRRSHYLFHRTTHTKQPGIVCEHCGAEFYRKTDLRRHLMKHTGEKPYACHLCSRRFTRRHYLTSHIRNHSISCSQCNYTCTSTVALLSHLTRSHSDTLPGQGKPAIRIVKSEAIGTKPEDAACPQGSVMYTMDLAKGLENSEFIVQQQPSQSDIQINIMDFNNQNQKIIIVPEVPVSGLPNALVVETPSDATSAPVLEGTTQVTAPKDTLHQAMSVIFDSEEEYVNTTKKEIVELHEQAPENTPAGEDTCMQTQLSEQTFVQDVFYGAGDNSEVAVSSSDIRQVELHNAAFDPSLTHATQLIATPDGGFGAMTTPSAGGLAKTAVSMPSGVQQEGQSAVTMDNVQEIETSPSWTVVAPGAPNLEPFLDNHPDFSSGATVTVNLDANNMSETAIFSQAEQAVTQDNAYSVNQTITGINSVENSINNPQTTENNLPSHIIQHNISDVDRTRVLAPEQTAQMLETGQIVELVENPVVESSGENQYQELILADGRTVRLLLNSPSAAGTTQENNQDQDSQYLLIVND